MNHLLLGHHAIHMVPRHLLNQIASWIVSNHATVMNQGVFLDTTTLTMLPDIHFFQYTLVQVMQSKECSYCQAV